MAGKVVWEEEALCLARRTVLPVEEYGSISPEMAFMIEISNYVHWYSKATTQPSDQ
jgi:hypothetical protein